jgi:2-polyprenyl-3-methyl-5-hydroxy-6-metoxy-1,4-benzoquinol methylase
MMGMIPSGADRILEVGSAGGLTGKELKAKGVSGVAGIEIVDDVARSVRPYYDAFYIGDVEAMDLPYEDGHFDCILYGDVLEHLRDPWNVLRKHNRLLRTGGSIVVSIPNIRHYRIIKKLAFKGQWEYCDDGIMDRTHLRFFTLRSVREMVADAGYV